MWKCLVLVFCIYVNLVYADDVWRHVNITQGQVRGRMVPEGGVYAFYNIPYATAPTGSNRYKAPLPPPVWLTPLIAEDRKIICPQSWPGSMNIQEDCLVANVYVPDTEETNLPVLVNIHGGGYQTGFGTLSEFNALVKTKKLIVVTFNYRLGVHGFLCLGTEFAPGNAGLKDMVALLRWVNTNIASFGGNPDDVTLAACSAGSGAVDFLTLSSITKGLFKKAIMESGVSIGGVGAQINPIQNAKNFAQVLNFNNVDDFNSLEEFYKSVSFEQLVSRLDAIVNNEGVTVRFGPCVEKDIGQERVVSDVPMDIMKTGNYAKIPLMFGFTDMDGALRLPVFDAWKDRMNEKFSDFLPTELHFDSEDIKEQVAEKVKNFYFGDDSVGDHSIVSFINYNTDVLFAYPMLKALSTRIEALDDTIYLFEYSFVDEDTPSFPHTEVLGADHCFQYIAVMDEDVTNRTEEYKQIKQIVRDNWVNFVLTGAPLSRDLVSQWPPASIQRSPYMSLGRDIVLRDSSPIAERAAFWDEIFEEHYQGPIVDTDATPTPDNSATSLMISNVTMLVATYLFLLLNRH
ncbi:unnamed protein product [Spodoptera littoralis]|uniref:Carboxylesterase type B domain-containing protein n=1 Tax=Spodoptera littoralis TaxID=7109 RepID=A0A9P0IAJ5_SPOLI|nr:unnamed protein product [Spodoptera littoralis]